MLLALAAGCTEGAPVVWRGTFDGGAPASDRSVADVARVMVRGRYEVTDHFAGGADAVTIVGDCNGDGRVDAINHDRVFVRRADGDFDTATLDGMDGRKAGSLVDLDGDAVLDLVLAGAAVEWRRGDGQCHFGAAQPIAPEVTGEAAQVLVRDVDLDGLADLTIARQEVHDRAYQFLIARGDGRFEDRTPAPTPRPNHGDMAYRAFGSFYDDLDGDGALDLFAVLDNDLGWFSWGVRGDMPAFAQDAAITNNLSQASPMSVSPLDYDRDGVMDYFVAGTFGHNRLYRYVGARALDDRAVAARIASAGMVTVDDLWGSLAFDVNLDGYPDLLALVLPDDHHDGGWIQLMVNQRNGTFALAGDGVIHEMFQATGLCCADFGGDGQMSCFVRDAMTRGLVMLRPHIEPDGGWVGLRLRGTVSSPDASGARVSLEGASPPLVVMAGGQSPTLGEHDRGVLLAIGSAPSAAVTIAWPSGLQQRVEGLAAGTYTTVTEPRVLDVPVRVAAADGRALVEVVVDPRAALATTVQIERSGDGAWEADARTDSDGRLHRMLRAPSAPGDARIEVSLDGHALHVRPRVRFE